MVCKKCGLDKPRRFAGLDKSNKIILIDDTGLKWQGYSCPQCLGRKHKPPKVEPVLNEQVLVKCRICLTDKLRIYKLRYPNGSRLFLDAQGNRWNGTQTCYECDKTKKKEYWRKKRATKHNTINCKNCNKEIVQSSTRNKFCSKACSYRSAHPLKPPKPKKEKPPKVFDQKKLKVIHKNCRLYFNTCPTCNKLFSANNSLKQYCKESHFTFSQEI